MALRDSTLSVMGMWIFWHWNWFKNTVPGPSSPTTKVQSFGHAKSARFWPFISRETKFTQLSMFSSLTNGALRIDPLEARMAFGWKGWALSGVSKILSAPKATAERTVAPKFEGSPKGQSTCRPVCVMSLNLSSCGAMQIAMGNLVL